jgi:alkanesulfonate monooxygenase SsuD/methylene tetrahydromethanopterin reductase-like flavin-dependent oxidoreductase (luciferase family)
MNWRRGLFRAWLLISVIWAVLATFIMSPLTEWRMANDDVSLSYDGETLIFPATLDRDKIERALVTYIRQRWTETPRENRTREGTPEEIAARMAASHDPYSRWKRMGTIVLAVTAPPLVLLCLGLALGWVGRGFRTKT